MLCAEPKEPWVVRDDLMPGFVARQGLGCMLSDVFDLREQLLDEGVLWMADKALGGPTSARTALFD
jgi:hypothetical protein